MNTFLLRLALPAALLVVGGLGVPAPRAAEVLFDFEPGYLVDPGHTIKDHAMVFDGTLWHAFYIRGTEGVSGTSTEKFIGHATSADLCHWTILPPVIEAGPDNWDTRNVWAPAILPLPSDPTRWTMLFTGADPNVVQRMGRAVTTNGDLQNWQKYAINPLLEPDTQNYLWDPGMQFSAFRDPFHFKIGETHHVLHTAVIEDLTIPPGRRGVVHHATSPDLDNWTDVGMLMQHNGPSNQAWHEIESVQLREFGGYWHFFYTESNVLGVQYQRSTQMDSGWDFTGAIALDDGIAAEVTPVDAESFLFTRHIPSTHSFTHPTLAGEIFYVLKVDSLRFDDATVLPEIVAHEPLAPDWPVRTGAAFLAAPTFGDNSLERGNAPTSPIGNGYISSREFYAGPGSPYGVPGEALGDGATGTMESRPFTVDAPNTQIDLRVAGGGDPNCFVELRTVDTDSVVATAFGTGSNTLQPVTWDVSTLQGRPLYLVIQDGSISSGGWIAVDHVVVAPDPTAVLPSARAGGALLPNVPNPFNPRTQLRFEIAHAGQVELEIFDLRGRRVLRLLDTRLEPGTHSRIWSGTDARGREVSSGVYRVRLKVDGVALDHGAITLAR